MKPRIVTTLRHPQRTALTRAMFALLAVSVCTLGSNALAAGHTSQASNHAIILQNHAGMNAQSSGHATQGSDRAIILQNQPRTKAVKPGQQANDRAIILQRHNH